MSDFMKELNAVSRSKEEVNAVLLEERRREIYSSMTVSKELMREFDENFLNNIKFCIKNKAYMGDYIDTENGKRQITGQFAFVKKYVSEYIGAYQFNGIEFENKKRKMTVPFEANLIVWEPVTQKRFIFKINGYKIYENTIIKDHIIALLEEEGIAVYDIENLPAASDFVTVGKFEKKYINRIITFHYKIEY